MWWNLIAGFVLSRPRGRKMLLNGEPIYLKTVLDQGYWPDPT